MAKFFIFLSLLICQLTLSEAVSVEPMCSKFSYDEQLLEKMVRMEFFVENVQKDAEKKVSNVMGMINDIQGNNSELSNRLLEQQEKVDNLERQADILNDTMANKVVVSENTESIRSIAAVVKNIRNNLENNTSGLDNLKVVTHEINKKCEDRLSYLSNNLEGLKYFVYGNLSIVFHNTGSINSMAADVRNIKNDLEESTSGLDNLKVVTNEINKKCEDGLSDLSKNLDRQTNDLKSSSTESMRNVSVVVANIKKDVEKSTSGLDDLKAVTDEVKTTCKDGLSDLSKRFAALEKQVKEMDQATERQSQTVAFNVMEAVPHTGSETMKFSNIILNEGNAYSKETGIFSTPIDGIYQFNAHICGIKAPIGIDYFIKVGTSSIVSGEFMLPSRVTSDTDTKCTSFSAVAMVRKDETVRVGGMPFTSLGPIAGNDLSSFSGVLIKTV